MSMKNPNAKSEENDWGVRDDLHEEADYVIHNQETAASSGGPMIKIKVEQSPAQDELLVPSHSTFGELKKEIAQETNLEPDKHEEYLYSAGVKDKSNVLVLENLASKENMVEEMKESEEMSKAFAAVARVRKEVDKLSERVVALEVAVDSGTKVAEEEFDVSAELLMRELLKLDGIEAEGEARLQRKAEVHRIQNFHERLDNLKAINSNPFSNSSKAASVTTKWETFESGMGSLTAPPPMSSSTHTSLDWRQFD